MSARSRKGGQRTRSLRVDTLARVEGEGALYVKLEDGRVADVQLRIFEPPRFFEAFLRGRRFSEVPDITARICGICPVAYQMSAVHAIESAFGVRVEGPLRALRRLLYCGEWIESHTLHIYMLHAPDFLGCADVVEMARRDAGVVERGLELKKTGNEVVSLLGGREIHPINVRVGGFYKVPRRRDLEGLAGKLARARDLALETVRWTASLPFPDLEVDREYVALRHGTEYPFNEGRIVSSRGLDTEARSFEEVFEEEQVRHSNALHCVLRGRGPYLVGPLARFHLNFDRFPPLVEEAAREAGVVPECRNPFRSIVVRSLEVLYACDEALRIIAEYEEPPEPAVAVEPRPGTGQASTEAPRGMLYHRYELDGAGNIVEARIVPPTSQNQKSIEGDLWRLVSEQVALPEDDLRWRCEQAIRNHDPCISCATHFLRLHLEGE